MTTGIITTSCDASLNNLKLGQNIVALAVKKLRGNIFQINLEFIRGVNEYSSFLIEIISS